MAGSVISAVTGKQAGDSVNRGLLDARAAQEEATQKAREQLGFTSDLGRGAATDFREGIGGGATFAETIADVKNDPFFQFQLEQGLDAVQGSAAAGGNLQSGRTLKALTEFSSGLAGQQAQLAFDRNRAQHLDQQNQLFGLAGMGFAADQGIANAELGLGANIADIEIARGNNKANVTNTIGAGISDLASSATSAFAGGGGGLSSLLSGGAI